MAGLAGVIHFDGRAPAQRTLRGLTRSLCRRPSEWVQDGPAALGLVIPEEHPDPPRPLVTDEAVILLDGWIDDPADLARRAGHDTPIASDAEALWAGWRRWGIDLVDRLDGELAAAIWDRRNQRLVLFRDRHGTRPLFWSRDGARFAFASRLPALLELPWVPRELNREHVAEYLSFQVVHAPRTLVRGVHQVQAAHWLRVDRDELATRRWWSLTYPADGAPVPRSGEVVPALHEAVQRAVLRRMRPGWKRALFLSGGLGSTAIAAAAKTLGRELPSYTVSFGDDPLPEAPFAGRIAGLLGLEHHDVVVESRDLAAAFDETVRALGHPVGDPSAVLLQLLAQAASTRAHLVFSGDGSEELFGGRLLDGADTALALARARARLPRAAQRLLEPALRRSRRGAAIAADPSRWGLSLGQGGNRLFSAEERAALLTDPSLARPAVRAEVLPALYGDVDTDPLNALLHAWMGSRLHESALPRTGRTADAAGLDARYPLLDREVVTMAAALPGSLKVRRRAGSLHTRWPLQAMLAGVLPPPLLNRPKRSMPLLHRWLAGAGRLFLEERLAALIDARHGLFQRRFLAGLRREVAADAGAARRLWTLFLLQGWIDRNGLG